MESKKLVQKHLNLVFGNLDSDPHFHYVVFINVPSTSLLL